MPRARAVLNAFPASKVAEITGMSLHMINYLLRAGYLSPSHGCGARGKVRYYSYRDLAVALVIQRLREAGIELKRIKAGIQMLSKSRAWLPPTESEATPLRFLVTDGKRVLLKTKDGFLDEPTGQRSFAFVVDLDSVEAEMLQLIPEPHREGYTMDTKRLRFEEGGPAKRQRRKKVQ